MFTVAATLTRALAGGAPDELDTCAALPGRTLPTTYGDGLPDDDPRAVAEGVARLAATAGDSGAPDPYRWPY
ncbi:hypothetical protein [Streptomyces sp.]|uniref:hypothetical protein n=1 Tax=Streptomyces sp. TaxID=1931 RepID=UPI002D4476D3|nr:hypothetical protein [Streptomyces sp.]HZF87504.1 hypothetical protein [Streptomyces sp.]